MIAPGWRREGAVVAIALVGGVGAMTPMRDYCTEIRCRAPLAAETTA